MHAQPFTFKRSRRGVALVIVLAFVVLLTGVILAYFTRAMSNRSLSDSSFHQARANELAKGALEIIIGDLKQEIVDGSTATTVGNSTVYLPDSATEMLPTRNPQASTNNLMPTLLRTSTDLAIASPGVDHAASDALSTTASANRKFVDVSRWNSHYLLPRPVGAVSGDSTPIPEFEAPKWVYVTDQGPITLTPPIDSTAVASVIGRYAYAIYDEGGLLDVNVAGYPMEPANVLPVDDVHPAPVPVNMKRFGYGKKGSIAFADLTALGISEEAVTDLVGWRNYASAQPAGSFGSFTFNTASAARFYDAIMTNSTGGLEVPNASWNGRTDQAVLSRQQLLALQKNLESKGFSPDALRHLGTFSRAVTSPSWGPGYDAMDRGAANNGPGNAYAYKSNADQTSSVNRNLPLVRHEASRTLRHYADDGTYEEYTATPGDPLMRTRFSLAKLAWLGHNGPDSAAFDSSLSSADREEAIEDCFGLTWNNSRKRWDYYHGANGILTLDEILAEEREPDFFEVLKAGILEGSLGTQPGEVAGDINYEPATGNITSLEKQQYWEGPIGRHYETYSADKDRHVLQIGANIIDQADNNNFPTAVYLNLSNQASFTVSENAFNNTVFGLENLPMLARMKMWAKVNGDEPPDPSPYPVEPLAVWLQPELWNPNDRSTAGSSVSDPNYPTPSALRLVTFGKAYVWNIKADEDMNNVLDSPSADLNYAAAEKFDSVPIDFGNDYDNPSVTGTICFKNPGPSSTTPPPFFDSPVGLTGKGSTTAQYNYFDATCPSAPENSHPLTANWLASQSGGTRFLGVYLGEVPHDGDHNGFSIRAIPDPQLSFALEYYDGAGWRPYAAFYRIESLLDSGGGSGSRYGQSNYSSSNVHIDPRTDRFSGSASPKASGNTVNWHGGTVRFGPGKRPNATTNSPQNNRNPIYYGWPRPAEGFTHNLPTNLGLQAGDNAVFNKVGGGDFYFDEWARNIDDGDWSGANINKPRFWYHDPDGIPRPGDGWRAIGWDEAIYTQDTGDGMSYYHSDVLPASKVRRRSVIMNRPFRSVGELGYVFRDLPFKSLDFWSEKSGDAGLLDLFSVRDEPFVTTGRINPNTASPEVLKAMIVNTLMHNGMTTIMSAADADSLVAELSAQLVTAPVANPGRLVDLAEAIQTGFSNSSSAAADITANKSNKAYAESSIRALSTVANTRTWNLMIDVIAQSGVFPRPGGDLAGSFLVQGELRFWLHLAIDRFTGEVVDAQLESVYE